MDKQKSTDFNLLTRRRFLGLAASAAGSVLVGNACSGKEDVRVGSFQVTDTSQPISNERVSSSTNANTATTEVPNSIDIASSAVSSTSEVLEVPYSLIDNSELIDRQKVFDIQVTLKGKSEAFIDLPVFACMLEPESYADILDNKGVMLDVARDGVNDDKFGDLGRNIRTEPIALPGETGAVILFAHRITEVSPDRDDNGGEDDGPEIPMFRDIDLITPGSLLEIQLVNGKSVRYIAIGSTDGIGGLPGVIPSSEGMAYKIVLNTNPDDRADYENSRKCISQDTDGRKLLRFVACHPKGSKKDRIIVEWEEIST